jgi:hypothetical protein
VSSKPVPGPAEAKVSWGASVTWCGQALGDDTHTVLSGPYFTFHNVHCVFCSGLQENLNLTSTWVTLLVLGLFPIRTLRPTPAQLCPPRGEDRQGGHLASCDSVSSKDISGRDLAPIPRLRRDTAGVAALLAVS